MATLQQIQQLKQAGLSDQQIDALIKSGGQSAVQKEGFSIGKTVKNIPGSALRFGGDIASAVFNPIETGKALGGVAIGAVQKLIPGRQGQEEKIEAVGQFFKERYGGIENIKKTLQEDPVGFAADISAFLTGGGAAIRGVGAVTKASKVAQVGSAIQKVGLATEPLTLAGKSVFIATKPFRAIGGAFLRESLGVTTGVGGEIIREAFRNPTREFTKALRGETTVENVLTTAREGLNTLREQRAAAYRSQLGKIKGAKGVIDTKAFKAFLDKKLKEFNVTVGADGVLDFSKSAIGDATEAKRIADFVEAVRKWNDNTPAGLDILKQRLDDFYTPSGKGRALTTSITDNLRQTLNKQVTGYAKLTADYADATKLIKEIEGTLSLKPGTRVDTTIRKLTSALKDNTGFRKALVEQLDELTKVDITQQLAGAALSPGVPAGLVGRQLFAGATVSGITAAGLGAVSPTILLGLGFASPRVVGELLRALGMGTKSIESFLAFIQSPTGKQILLSLFEAKRAKEANVPPDQQQ